MDEECWKTFKVRDDENAYGKNICEFELGGNVELNPSGSYSSVSP